MGSQNQDIPNLNLWTGDLIFFRLLQENVPFFSLKLRYEGDRLALAAERQRHGRGASGAEGNRILDSVRGFSIVLIVCFS